MRPPLCDACRRIDPDFFSPAFDNPGFMQGPTALHLPINWMRRSASAGCPLCTCLIASCDTESLPEEVVLRRAVIDAQQAVVMHVGWDDVSHTLFFRIPSAWWALPSAALGRPCRDLELMSFWIQDCVRHHSRCSSDSADPFLPTRLLDVKAFERSKDLKLVTLTGKGVAVNYVALSHCWGPASKRPLTTTTKSLAQNLRRISFLDLSLTFQDAVQLTLDLKQRYLWIDSLCIVQDDKEDWLQEASKMASVYGNALFTLSALSSVDSTHGCRIPNPLLTAQGHRFFDFDTGLYRVRLFEGGIKEWHEEYGDDTYRHGTYGENPLRGRAWTLQERELSTRNIHFSQNLVLWECNTLKASSQLPWRDLKPVDDFQPWPIRVFSEESLSSDGSLSVRDRWYELMEDYMARNLTYELDKLPALSGLAQSFQRRLPSSQYLAGIWTDHLPRALLWRMGLPNSGSNAQRPTTWRAPSWSFLSLNGYMSYESQRLFNGGGKRPEETPNDRIPTDLIVLDCHVQPTGADIYGTIGKAELSLRGKIMQIRLRRQFLKESEDRCMSTEPWEALESASGSNAGVAYLDIRNESLDSMRVWFVPVCPDPSYSVVQAPSELYPYYETEQEAATAMGLAIQEDSNASGTFRRVGMVRWVKRSLFEGIAPSDFKLI